MVSSTVPSLLTTAELAISMDFGFVVWSLLDAMYLCTVNVTELMFVVFHIHVNGFTRTGITLLSAIATQNDVSEI